MPAQESSRLHNNQHLAPSSEAAGEKHQNRPIRGGNRRARDTPTQHDQLVTEQHVLHDQFVSAADQIWAGTSQVRGCRRCAPEALGQDAPQCQEGAGEASEGSDEGMTDSILTDRAESSEGRRAAPIFQFSRCYAPANGCAASPKGGDGWICSQHNQVSVPIYIP
jgi:hypothetical protein